MGNLINDIETAGSMCMIKRIYITFLCIANEGTVGYFLVSPYHSSDISFHFLLFIAFMDTDSRLSTKCMEIFTVLLYILYGSS